MAFAVDSAALSAEGCLALYPIIGEGVRLRPLALEHLDRLAELANHPDVARTTARLPHPYARSDAQAFYERAQGLVKNQRGVVLAIERKADGLLLGVVSVEEKDDRPATAELGYWVGRDFWGQGFTSEAARLIAAHAFDDLGYACLVACVFSGNIASERILQKVGFVPTGACHACGDLRCDLRGTFAQGLSMELTRAAFAVARKSRLLLVAAAALVDSDNRVLLQQRPPGKHLAGLWEFPGGKVESGETPERALIRELNEELGIDVRQSCLAPLSFASHDYGEFHLLMPLFVCRQWRGTPHGVEGQVLSWVPRAKLRSYPMPPADVPLLAALLEWI